MKTLFVEDISNKVGQEIEFYGWVHNIRTHKNIIFIDFRDRSGIVQVVADNKFKTLSPEDVVIIKGTVNKRPANMVNEKLKTGEIEVQAKEFKIISHAETPPFDMSKKTLNVSLPILLDYRSLTL